jgi:hypothetical protein
VLATPLSASVAISVNDVEPVTNGFKYGFVMLYEFTKCATVAGGVVSDARGIDVIMFGLPCLLTVH